MEMRFYRKPRKGIRRCIWDKGGGAGKDWEWTIRGEECLTESLHKRNAGEGGGSRKRGGETSGG